jgi:hypothetical protein
MPCIFYDHFFEWGDTLKNEISSLLEVSPLFCIFALIKEL